MNSGINVLGQGNRANATIGRALQLVVRNVGGGRPGEVDRATLGNPGKYTFCFAEDEDGSPWEPLHVERGLGAGPVARSRCSPARASAGIVDQLSARRPSRSRARFAACLRAVPHPKLALGVRRDRSSSRPSTRASSARRGWSKARLRDELLALLPARRRRRRSAAPAASPRACPRALAGATAAEVPRRRPPASCTPAAAPGLFSAIIGGWVNGPGRQPARHPGGEAVSASTCPARPDRRARSAATASASPRPDVARRPDRRPARHLQAARRRVPRPARGAARRARPAGAALHASRRSPSRRPIDLRHEIAHAVRRGDRGARRLRLVHVVQCARHRQPRGRRHPRRVRRVERVRRRRRRAGRARSAPIRPGVRRRTRSRTAPTTSCARWPTARVDEILRRLLADR